MAGTNALELEKPSQTAQVLPLNQHNNRDDGPADGPAPDDLHYSRMQQLERYITLKPMVAFGLTLQASWESVAISFQTSLLNGGPVSLVYGMIIAALGSSAVALSLGEMASIDPTVGAQYRWTARHCPRRLSPKFWGLLQGWLTWFAWIASTTINPYVLGTMIQAMIIFNNPDYVFKRWHTVLLIWACILFMEENCSRHSRYWAAYAIFFFFICNVVTLGVLAQRQPSSFVWTTLVSDQSGWTNPGAAFCIGLLSPTFVISAFDGVLHMSDETKDAPKRVPWSMFLAVAINSVFSFAFIICLLYCLGDLDTVLSSPTGLPIIEVYYEATKSVAATNVFMFMLLLIATIGTFNIIASVSRLTWAFARDKGLPFSHFFSYVDPKFKIPTRALWLVTVLCLLLGLIDLGSTTAFSAILSLATLALYISYIPPVLFFLIRKLNGRHPTYGPFTLGRWGIPINILALVWSIFICVWLPFPVTLPVTAATMNYAAPVWGGCLLLALADWVISGRKRFEVPVAPEIQWQEEESFESRTEKVGKTA